MRIPDEELLNQDVTSLNSNRDEARLANGYRLVINRDDDSSAYQWGEFYLPNETRLESNSDNTPDYTEKELLGDTLTIVIKESNRGYYTPRATLAVFDERGELVQEVTLNHLSYDY